MAENQIRGIEGQDCPAIRVTQNAGCPSIRVKLTGGGETPEAPLSDVNFYDYDGKRVASYTAADFAALTEMPANPSHQGLTAQGWNWSLADAQAYVAAYGILDIGQNYITDDGKTRFYLRIDSEARNEIPITYTQSISEGVVIDWGDGSTPERVAGTSGTRLTHSYNPGEYILTVEVTEGTVTLGGGSYSYPVIGSSSVNTRVFTNMVKRIELGSGIVLANGAFGLFTGLTSISIPKYLTAIPTTCFYEAVALRFIALPEGCVVGDRLLYYNYSLSNVSLPKDAALPANYFNTCRSLQRICLPAADISDNAFYYCSDLSVVIIPQGCTAIGTSAFYNCQGIALFIIPASVTSIGATAFRDCRGVGEFHFKGTTPPTIASDTFSNIPADCKIYVPASAVATYQGATNWSTYASQIVGE